jgi:hypothetical protein
MTDVLIQHGNRWLLLSLSQYEDALLRADELMPDPERVTNGLPEFLTAEEMATATGVPRSWWFEAAKSGLVEHTRFGKYVRFPAAILSANNSESVAPNPSKQAVARLSAVQSKSEKQS